MKDWGLYSCRVIAGLVFCASAILKLLSIDAFELYLYSLDLFPLGLSFVLARVLIAGELVLGLSLMLNQWRALVNGATYILLGVFSIFLIVQIANGVTSNCHCMGEQIDLPPIPSLIKNVILAALVIISNLGKKFDIKYNKIWMPLMGVAAFVAIFIISPPDNFTSHKPISIHKDKMEIFLAKDSIYQQKFKQQRTLVCLFSTSCHVCKLSARKMQLLIDQHNIPDNRIYEIFVGEPSKLPEWYQKTNSRPYTHQMLSSDVFWPLTHMVPTFAVVENGKVKAAYSYRAMDEELFENLMK